MIQSTTDALKTRAELLDRINTSVQELNKRFISNPQDLDTKSIRKLISELVETNRFLEDQKQGLQANWWNKNGDKVSLLFLGIMGLGGLILTITNIFQFTPSLFNVVNTTSTSSRMLSYSHIQTLKSHTAAKVASVSARIADSALRTNAPDILSSRALQVIIVFFIVGIACTIIGGVGGVVADRKDKRENSIRQNLDSVMQLRQVGEENLERMLAIFEEFKNQAPEARDPKKIHKCIKALDKMPKNGLERIKKENLVPHMIEDLPHTNPLFLDYYLLKTSIPNNADDVEVEPYEETPVTESTDSSLDGEQTTAVKSMPLLFKAKRIKNPKKNNYHKLWGKLENRLGFSMKSLRVGDTRLNKDGTVHPVEPDLVSFLEPVRHSGSEESTAPIDDQFNNPHQVIELRELK